MLLQDDGNPNDGGVMLGKKYPASYLKEPDGSKVLRLLQNFNSEADATARQREIAGTLGLQMQVVRKMKRENHPMVILEVKVKGKSQAEALRKKLQERKLDVVMYEL